MKTIIISAIGVCLLAMGAIAADSLSSRQDLFGPMPSQWSTSNQCYSKAIKTSPGIVGCVTISSAPSVAWGIYDSSDVLTYSTAVSTFPASVPQGTYCFNQYTTEGIAAIIAVNGSCNVNVGYR